MYVHVSYNLHLSVHIHSTACKCIWQSQLWAEPVEVMLSWLESLSGVKGSRLSRSRTAVLLKGNTGDPWWGFSYSPGVIDAVYSLSTLKTVCAWWRAIPYKRWPCYAEHSRSKGVNLEKIIPNPTVWVPCLWDEWQWVGLSQMAPSGLPSDLPEVI